MKNNNINKALLLTTLALTVQVNASQIDPNTPSNASPDGSPAGNWQLVFSDEFKDTVVDAQKWRLPYVDNGWDTTYGLGWFHSQNNISEDGEHMVVSYVQNGTNMFSSGRADSQGLFEKAYGYFETRVEITTVEGHQSAFWLMPNGGTLPGGVANGSANDGAEIDVLEANRVNDEYATNIHYDGYGANHGSSHAQVGASGIHTGWHTFGLEWSPTALKFYYDGILKRTITQPYLIAQVKEYPIVSGGIFEGPWVDGSIRTATLPDNGLYDYVRVYHNKEMDYGDDYFKVVNKADATVLTHDQTNASDAWVVTETGINAEHFQLTQVSTGNYKLINRESGKCLKANNSNEVKVKPCTTNTNQQWTLEAAQGNYLKLKNVRFSGYLQQTTAGDVEISTASTMNEQQWEVTWVEKL